MPNFQVVNIQNRYLQLRDQDTGFWLTDDNALVADQEEGLYLSWSVVNESRLNNEKNLLVLNSLDLTVR